jgi:type I restriction enzyme S subunit
MNSTSKTAKTYKKAPLSTFADITMGQSPESNSYNSENRGMPFLQGCAEFGAFHPTPFTYCSFPLRIAKKDSILISVRAPVGVTNWSDQDYCIGRGLGAIKAKENLADTKFLQYAIEQNVAYLHQRSQGSTFLAINTSDLKSLPIPDIPQPVQSKIAKILSTLDQAIEKTEALIDKYQQIKQGLMHDLFTRGIAADGKLRPPRSQAPELYKKTPIGWIPEQWDVYEIGNLFDIQLGKMLSKASKTGKSSAFYLGNKNVQWDRVDLSDLEYMDFSKEERQKFSLQFGDLLVCEGGEVGRTAIWRNEFTNCFYQKAIHRLRPLTSNVAPQFVLRFMRYASIVGLFTKFTSQSSIAHLTQEKLEKVNISIPSINEQKQMINHFDSLDQKVEKETEYLAKLQKQKSGLMHDLLTGKVEVNVNAKEAVGA